jgi:Transcriptional regulator C-terminal region
MPCLSRGCDRCMMPWWRKDYLVEQGEAKVCELTPTNQQLPVPPAMYVQYVAGAVLCTLAWWLEHDMPYSPQNMAQYLLLLHGTSSYHS